MTAFRLVELHRSGPRTWSPVFDTVDSAREAADVLFAAVHDRPGRRPWAFDVIDVATGERVTRLFPDPDRDTSVCLACGQPLDPFAPGETGSVAPDPPTPPGRLAPPAL